MSKSKTAFLNGRRIEAMHRYYGIDPSGGICADCQHLMRMDYHDRTYYKCVLYGVSHGESTDWRKGWQACMLIDHDPDESFEPVINRLEPKRKQRTEIEGQMRMEERNEATD